MNAPQFDIRELRDPDGEYALQAIKIYEESFPEEEREPVENLIASIRNGMRSVQPTDQVKHFWIALDKETVLGLAMFTYYRDTRLAFISYMAIRANRRNQGLGSLLFRRLLEQLPRDASYLDGLTALGACFEVERPEDARDEIEHELRRRRIRFYQRNGAQLIKDIDFVAPPLGENLPPISYYLMFRQTDATPVTQTTSLYQAIVKTILVYGYKLQLDDPYTQKALASIMSSPSKSAT